MEKDLYTHAEARDTTKLTRAPVVHVRLTFSELQVQVINKQISIESKDKDFPRGILGQILITTNYSIENQPKKDTYYTAYGYILPINMYLNY